MVSFQAHLQPCVLLLCVLLLLLLASCDVLAQLSHTNSIVKERNPNPVLTLTPL
jgi:hypothetical protein